jgi:WD40 repeat protein
MPPAVSPTLPAEPATQTPGLTPTVAGDPAPLTTANAVGLSMLQEIVFQPWEIITALAWSPDGAWIAVAAGENLVLIRTEGWGRIASYRLGGLAHGLAFSPDSAWLAAATRDGFLRAWPVSAFAASNTQPGLEVEAHRKGANAVAFSPQFGQGQGAVGWLLASGGNDAMARFWDVSSGENTGQMVGGTFAVASIVFLPDGDLLAVTNGDRIRLREAGSERIAGTFASDAPLYSLAVSPDGTRLAAGGSDNLVRLYDVESAYRSGQEVYPDPVVLQGHAAPPDTYRALIWQVAFSPDGALLASVGGDGGLRLWDVAAAAPLAALPAHRLGATGAVFSPDGTMIATGGLDGVVRIWSANP